MISEINNKSLLETFKEHLSDTKNSRILFSGPFGTGKTTFIDQFSEQNKSEFVFLKIAPVNYSVSSNEDIFDLIKFDLIIELLNNYGEEIDLSAEEFPVLLTMQMFVKVHFNLLSTLTFLSTIMPGFSKSNPEIEAFETISAIGSKLNKSANSIFDAYKKFQKDVEQNPELKKIEKFIEKQENIAGINESDKITGLIKDLIQRVKASKSETDKSISVESVMIVDDLDRLDSEHIFRLFNVFSAHYDAKDHTNKFGFDKVIFICDLNNIRQIYHHRYGANVDFTGYIDKFFSKQPFDFDNRAYIRDKVREIIVSVNLKQNAVDKAISEQDNFNLFTFLEFILICLINARLINLRMIVPQVSINLTNKTFQANRFELTSVVEHNVLTIFYILKGLFHSWQEVENSLQKLSHNFNTQSLVRFYSRTNTDYIRIIELVINECYPFHISESLVLANTSRNKIHPVKIRLRELDLSFIFQSEFGNHSIFEIATFDDVQGSEHINPFTVILETFKNTRKKNIIV